MNIGRNATLFKKEFEMDKIGNENYVRTQLIYAKGGGFLAKKLFRKRVKELSPPEGELTVDEFLANNKMKLLRTKKGQIYRKTIYPESSPTNFNDWNLDLVCFILLELCDLVCINRKDIEKLQKLLEKLQQLPEPILDKDVFEERLEKINILFNRTCKLINDETSVNEIKTIVNKCEKDPISKEDLDFLLHELNANKSGMLDHSRDSNMLENQTKIVGDQASQMAKLEKVLGELESIGRRLPPDTVIKPGHKVHLELTNCTEEVEKKLSKDLAKKFSDKCHDNDAAILTKAVQQTVETFSQRGQTVEKVEHKCLLFLIRCDGLSTYIQLIRECLSGNIINQFKHLLAAVKSIEGCENVIFRSVYYVDEILDTIADLVTTLDSLVPMEDTKMHTELIEREVVMYTSAPKHPGDILGQSNQSEHVLNFNIENIEMIDRDSITGEMAENKEDSEQEVHLAQDYNQNPYFTDQVQNAELINDKKYLELKKSYAELMEKNKKLETDNEQLKNEVQALCHANKELMETNKKLETDLIKKNEKLEIANKQLNQEISDLNKRFYGDVEGWKSQLEHLMKSDLKSILDDFPQLEANLK